MYGCSDSGPVSVILAGINWVLARMASLPGRRAVVNMSFGGGVSAPLNAAVAQLVAAGAVVVVAAGNSGADACETSPAGARGAITVAAIDATSTFASFSNTGRCVAISAPGVQVTSDWVGSPEATMVLSGTSMASPITAGVAALILEAFPDATPSTVRNTLTCFATGGEIVGVPANTPDAIVYSPPSGFDKTCRATEEPVPGTTSSAAALRAPTTLLAVLATVAVAVAFGRAAGLADA